MKVICILCDQPFIPDKFTEKKLRKHPHRIQLCPDCYVRIKNQVLKRQRHQQEDPPTAEARAAQTPELHEETNLYSND
ncbi:DUF2197 domain-containing protein [Paenactinomyces guangxiensis]|uniref:DUF2197 domain-containing protein n=1 Tax=Paenactinomyces guangxiensis TaxID=1490290 RepID=A0A7W2A790_9BACL|nr:DUF2197 domain-containing protein [Paenactinomyces guangxiensis]MBA4494281.1 DUF2197 domain-containing protein [Paenactinomyces guangxiensis]MBH8590775.1 DUF2197 domain-containing protein [Paenactinomyces guangxiensis]